MGIKLREKYKGEFTEEELHQMETIRIGHMMLGLSMSSMPEPLKEKARAAGYRVDAPPADHHL